MIVGGLIENLLHTRNGQIIISIIWGLGLALIFFMQVCEGPQCIVFKAPPKSVESQIYEHLGDCYAFLAETTDCGVCPIKSTPGNSDKGGKCYKNL